ncbi:MAG: hypothetical protein P1P86_11015 [Bacteroidales bacterium]|nr:hypothetical protein [Bacteroidales bacterium]
MRWKNTYTGWMLIGCLVLAASPVRAQYLSTHISNQGIYLFLDELATQKVIDLHSLVKPYGRLDIAEMLLAADSSRSELNRRQQSELDFYLRDYQKDLPPGEAGTSGSRWLWLDQKKRFDAFYYRDSLFRMSINPILGGDLRTKRNGSFYHWWNGVEASSTIGRFGIWASLRDNHESTELTARDFQNQRIGGSNIKIFSEGKRDYWELRAGISYGWDWGHVGLILGQFAWGENNAGANIFSGRTPAFPRLELAMDPAPWFRFTYVHGSLISEVVDSTLSFTTSTAYGTDFREVYHSKYLAANIFTFTPATGLQLSVGNSVIYDYRHPHAAFLLPVAFYKAIDHTLNARIDNMNSQLFLSASSRNLKHLHLYGTVFLDEVAVDRIFHSGEHNFVSYKLGAASTLLSNTRISAEYTWSNALTFMHNILTTTFESNQYNLGHYLEDNARQLYLGMEFRPVRTLNIKAYYKHSEKGPDHTALGTMPRQGITSFDPIVWESVHLGLLATCQLLNDLYMRLGYEWRNVSGELEYLDRWTPEEYHGETGTFRIGLNYGF